MAAYGIGTISKNNVLITHFRKAKARVAVGYSRVFSEATDEGPGNRR